jgi:glutamine---fructose-6-phosphate transaminase (isomerizing)
MHVWLAIKYVNMPVSAVTPIIDYFPEVKNMYESHAEIFRQYESLAATMEKTLSMQGSIRGFFEAEDYDDIVFVACGSSYWLSLSAHMTFQEQTGKRAFAVKAGDIVMNPEYYSKAYRRPLLVTPSRSGETSEVLRAIEILRGAYVGARVLSTVEYQNSTLESVSDLCIGLPWANEASVCQTRSFSSLYLCLVVVAAIVSGNNELIDGLQAYIKACPALFASMEKRITAITSEFNQCDSLVVVGNGKQYGVAIEAAYIAIEMAAFPANYYSTLELRHGPIVRLGANSLVAVVSNTPARAYEEAIAADSRRKGAKVLSVVDQGKFKNANWVFELGGDYPPEAVALYAVAILQGFSHDKAIQLGVDPDNPAELIPFIRM